MHGRVGLKVRLEATVIRHVPHTTPLPFPIPRLARTVRFASVLRSLIPTIGLSLGLQPRALRAVRPAVALAPVAAPTDRGQAPASFADENAMTLSVRHGASITN